MLWLNSKDQAHLLAELVVTPQTSLEESVVVCLIADRVN